MSHPYININQIKPQALNLLYEHIWKIAKLESQNPETLKEYEEWKKNGKKFKKEEVQ